MLALGVFDALPVVLPDERKGMAERALFLALKGLTDQEGSRRRKTEEQTSVALDGISGRLADLEKATIGLSEVEVRTVLEATDSKVEQLKGEVMTAVKALRFKVQEVKAQEEKASVEWDEKPLPVELSAELRGAIARLSGKKVFHGPANLGGGPFRLAAAQRALGVQATSVCYPSPLYRYPTDRNFEAPDALTRLSPDQLEFMPISTIFSISILAPP